MLSVPATAGRVHLHAVSIEQRRELIEGDLGRATAGNNVEIGERQAGLDRVAADGLQELRLKQLADPRDLQPRLAGVEIGEEPVRGRVGRIERERLRRLVDAQLLEAEIVVDPREADAAGGLVLVKQEARAVDGAVVVQLDRLLELAQRLDRAIVQLQADRVVEPGRGVVRIELLGDRVLLGVQRVAPLLEVRLAQVAADQRVVRIEGRGDLDLLAPALEIAARG